jgi:hypothetical protein
MIPRTPTMATIVEVATVFEKEEEEKEKEEEKNGSSFSSSFCLF